MTFIPDLVPAEQVIDIGRAAHMQCLTEERDRATILWRKDGLVLSSNNRISLNQQTLQIYNLQREDYGVYQCFVTRGNREVQATAQLRLGGESHTAIGITLRPDMAVTFNNKLISSRKSAPQTLPPTSCTSSSSKPCSRDLRSVSSVVVKDRQLHKFLGPKTDFLCPHLTGINLEIH